MEALLAPATDPRAALSVAVSCLARRWRRFRLARRLLPRTPREELVAFLAWDELVRSCERLEGAERARLLERLADEVGAICARTSRSAVGLLLQTPVQRLGISELSLRKPLAAIEELSARHVLASRSELVGFARRLADPGAQALLLVAGITDDRSRLLATALATGLLLAAWIPRIPFDLARGRLFVPLEDLARFGLGLDQLARGDERVRGLVAEQIGHARTELQKGWPLAAELGPWRGRCLAFVLRWNAATLSAIEARGAEVFPGPPRAGWPRLVACVGASLRSTAAPF